ncbi:MAG: hypothetical protein ABIL45_04370 [candidate division WOR-3 bacterium]
MGRIKNIYRSIDWKLNKIGKEGVLESGFWKGHYYLVPIFYKLYEKGAYKELIDEDGYVSAIFKLTPEDKQDIAILESEIYNEDVKPTDIFSYAKLTLDPELKIVKSLDFYDIEGEQEEYPEVFVEEEKEDKKESKKQSKSKKGGKTMAKRKKRVRKSSKKQIRKTSRERRSRAVMICFVPKKRKK